MPVIPFSDFVAAFDVFVIASRTLAAFPIIYSFDWLLAAASAQFFLPFMHWFHLQLNGHCGNSARQVDTDKITVAVVLTIKIMFAACAFEVKAVIVLANNRWTRGGAIKIPVKFDSVAALYLV